MCVEGGGDLSSTLLTHSTSVNQALHSSPLLLVSPIQGSTQQHPGGALMESSCETSSIDVAQAKTFRIKDVENAAKADREFENTMKLRNRASTFPLRANPTEVSVMGSPRAKLRGPSNSDTSTVADDESADHTGKLVRWLPSTTAVYPVTVPAADVYPVTVPAADVYPVTVPAADVYPVTVCAREAVRTAACIVPSVCGADAGACRPSASCPRAVCREVRCMIDECGWPPPPPPTHTLVLPGR